MASNGVYAMLLALMAVVLAGLANAQTPGDDFPYYDNCRSQQANQMRIVTYLGRKPQSDGTVNFCWRIDLKDGNCTQEVFYQKDRKVNSRCCNTTFAKIKFYTNLDCKYQFQPSNLTVPLMPELSKIVSPTWEYDRAQLSNYTSVKYTQFGPIPQSAVDGTTFCLKLDPPTGKPGKNCSTDGLIGITNPRRLPHGDFQLAIYDRKTDNYECCPTFNYQVAAPYNTTRRRHRNRLAVRRAARRAA